MAEESGRVGSAETGSRPTGHAPSGRDASRFDPARDMVHRMCAVLAERNPDTPRSAFEGDVLALLDVMREPTPGMLEAVTFDDGEFFFDAENAESVWGCMIDAAIRRDRDRDPEGDETRNAAQSSEAR